LFVACVVSCDTDTIYLYDLGSTNGTFLDEVRIPSLTKVEIRDGAILSFGGSTRTYTLKWHEGLKVSGQTTVAQNHHCRCDCCELLTRVFFGGSVLCFFPVCFFSTCPCFGCFVLFFLLFVLLVFFLCSLCSFFGCIFVVVGFLVCFNFFL
jgi:hypothetical protein